MGLDMYLTKRVYVKNWDHMDKSKWHIITVKVDDKEVPQDIIDTSKIRELILDAGYWRKQNQIHAWFVKNVQDGVDNCEEFYVSEEKLQELLEICETVLKDKTMAGELLPPQEGFFFGTTELDEWYFKGIEDTVEILKEALASPNGDFYYHSSW